MLGGRFDQFKDEEIVLRSVIIQRGPRPPLPSSLPPDNKSDTLCSSVAALSMSSSTSSSCTDDETNTLGSPLKFVRRNVLSSKADTSLNGRDPFSALPWNVMYQIFETFELRDRLIASKVCRRWNNLLTDGRFPLGELSVLNLFEKTVWEQKLSQSIQSGGKVECIHLCDFDQLSAVFSHCLNPRVVKIWYQSLEFLERAVQLIKSCQLKLHSLDVYPYDHYVGASLVHEHLPDLKHISMRPHCSDYFFTGLDIEHLPDFVSLESLNIDSFNLIGNSKLPANLKNLDWQCRNEKSLAFFISRLEPLKKLEFLSIGHANFTSISFLKFIQNVGFWNMDKLQYLYFKLVKFTKIDAIALCEDFSPRVLHALKVLRMELCYGNLRLVTELFLRMTGPNLKILSLSLLTDEKEILFKDLFDMSRNLDDRNLNLHLSLMEPNEPVFKETVGGKEGNREMPACPTKFANLITKFEASFISSESTLNNILGAGYFPNLTEIKLIQCQAADDNLLCKIAQNCPALERLSVLSCHECTSAGIQHFVETFHKRKSDTLKIIWQRDRSNHSSMSFITDFFLYLTSETPWLCEGLSIRSKRKLFRAKFGEQVIIWNAEKTLYIQDFDFYDQNRVLGVVLPSESNEVSGSSEVGGSSGSNEDTK